MSQQRPQVFTMRVSADELAMLGELSRADDRSKSGVLRRLIVEAFGRRKLKLPSKRGAK